MRDKALPFFDDDLGDASDWIPLDQLLGKDPFSRLETVKINFFGGEEWKKCDLGADFVDYFQERLPMLYGRRILRSRYDWEDEWVEGDFIKAMLKIPYTNFRSLSYVALRWRNW